nr:13585_t:CDS:2 [Entrophospora candida]CAG8472970.1 6748_t:CDS:2 [Entrophospora candida]
MLPRSHNNNKDLQVIKKLSFIQEHDDPFDYQATVDALVHQFLDDHEETRIASFDWLLMLHKKAPKKVVKRDLQLLAQLSSSSEDEYFTRFMIDLLKLFSTDRKLLENRGSLIIRHLCLSLDSERIYRSFAEILEKEEDIEFASSMVQNLNSILITSPELSDLRKRLKNLETKDGQLLFTALYKSWCHNPVATFSLYLDITVNLLIQIDKLVQLLESPVFTYLRLQLLEPEKYPYLFKCLYGLLMLLPQSGAFASLKNRLTSVSSMGFLHLIPKSAPTNDTKRVTTTKGSSSSSKDEGIKFQELLNHFRAVQNKHEKTRQSKFLLLSSQSSRSRRSRDKSTYYSTSSLTTNPLKNTPNSNGRNTTTTSSTSNNKTTGTASSHHNQPRRRLSSSSANSDHGHYGNNINSYSQSPPTSNSGGNNRRGKK